MQDEKIWSSTPDAEEKTREVEAGIPSEPGRKMMYCPRWLDEDAKKEWRRLSAVLIQEGLLTEKTYNSFASYCQEWSRYQKQQILINEKGVFMNTKRGEIREAPFVSIAYKALRALQKSATDLGLSKSTYDE